MRNKLYSSPVKRKRNKKELNKTMDVVFNKYKYKDSIKKMIE